MRRQNRGVFQRPSKVPARPGRLLAFGLRPCSCGDRNTLPRKPHRKLHYFFETDSGGIMARARSSPRVKSGAIPAVFLFSDGSEIYSAVPFIGTVYRLISLPSSSKRAFFRWIPPPYPVRLSFAPITRWHGTMMQIGL